MNFIAKKSLGQNFLHAPNVISAMIHAGNVQKDDIVLEVGPGKGALTGKLLEAGARVIAIEKD
ncbi:MAG: rRNA adenine N-6-methyltransferase family protein, partial [Candidatus Taylorbacteria bacterium]|nr:rRNA adenine N-6-methyltransferase family protein [Candidatus Taylorbacteria bacterium]